MGLAADATGPTRDSLVPVARGIKIFFGTATDIGYNFDARTWFG
jgi:hypothetical protein